MELYRKTYFVGLEVDPSWGGPVDASEVPLERVAQALYMPQLAELRYRTDDELLDALYGLIVEEGPKQETFSMIECLWGVSLQNVMEENQPDYEPWDDILYEGVRFPLRVDKEPIEYDDAQKKLLVKLGTTGHLTLEEGLDLAELQGITSISDLRTFVSDFNIEHSEER